MFCVNVLIFVLCVTGQRHQDRRTALSSRWRGRWWILGRGRSGRRRLLLGRPNHVPYLLLMTTRNECNLRFVFSKSKLIELPFFKFRLFVFNWCLVWTENLNLEILKNANLKLLNVNF